MDCRHLVILLAVHDFVVSQDSLTSDVPTNTICPNECVVFTCIIDNAVVMRWLVNNSTSIDVLITYSDGSSTNSPTVISPGIEVSLVSVQPDGNEFDFTSTLTVSEASALGNVDVICDGGDPVVEIRQTVELTSPPATPEYTCTLPGGGALILTWTNTGDAEEYLYCSCTGVACPCVPTMDCGGTSTCNIDLDASQEQDVIFTAVNCDDQRSNTITLSVNVPAPPTLQEVCVQYNQSTGDLFEIGVLLDSLDPVPILDGVDCRDDVGIRYRISCDNAFEAVVMNASCNGACEFNFPAGSGCTLSVNTENAVGRITMAGPVTIRGSLSEVPLSVSVFSGRLTCSVDCDIQYGTDPNNLVNMTSYSTPDARGAQLQLVQGVDNFYCVTAMVPPLKVRVKGIARTGSDNMGAIIGGVVGGIGGVILVLVLVVYLWYRYKKNKGSPDERELRERTRSADGGDVEVAEVEVNTATYADPSAIDRQEFPGTQDVYTVVDKTKKVHKPEDHLPTYQTPEEIKREAAPATGQMYTVPEAKKGSKKKKEAPPPTKSEEELQQMYSQVDMGKKHQPPSGLVYSDISLPPAGKVPPSKSVNYTDVQPHH